MFLLGWTVADIFDPVVFYSLPKLFLYGPGNSSFYCLILLVWRIGGAEEFDLFLAISSNIFFALLTDPPLVDTFGLFGAEFTLDTVNALFCSAGEDTVFVRVYF